MTESSPKQPMSQNVLECPSPTESSQLGPDGLNEKQMAAIEMLAAGKALGLAAKDLGIDRRTLFRWRQQEPFREVVRQRHRELWGDASERLRMLIGPAVEILAEHMNDQYDRSRFRGAMAVLSLTKLHEPQ